MLSLQKFIPHDSEKDHQPTDQANSQEILADYQPSLFETPGPDLQRKCSRMSGLQQDL